MADEAMSLYGPSGHRRQPTGRAPARHLMDAEYRVNRHPYWKMNHWRVYQATEHGRGPDIPPWNFWAAHWDLDEPPAVAASLAELEKQVIARQAAMYERLPLALRNRRTLAVRMGWPEGVVEACEELEETYPAWSVTWRPEGYVGQLGVPVHECEVTADDPSGLDVLMEEVPLEHDYSLRGCAWCLARADRKVLRASLEFELRRERRFRPE